MYTVTYDAARLVLHGEDPTTVTADRDRWANRIATTASAIGTIDHDLAFLAEAADRDPATFGDLLDALDADDFPGSFCTQATTLVHELVLADATAVLADADQVRVLCGQR